MILGPVVLEAAAQTPTNITVYERTSQTLEQTAALVPGDDVYLPMKLLVDRLGLRRKALTKDRLGICRGDTCIPLSVGTLPGTVRRIGDAEFVPIAPLVEGLHGIKYWDAGKSDLLLDLARRQDARQTMVGAELDLTLPDLTGKPVSLSSFRGKKVLLFAWASW